MEEEGQFCLLWKLGKFLCRGQWDQTCQNGVKERLEGDFSESTLAAAPQIGKNLGLSIGVSDEGLTAMFHESEDRRISELRG